jgi:alkanesulfonate monooxygenase SsuD/methylene tetrahydromethanopterin reductase-like flavin-dependent oxidoreductase (luciferase family)
MAAMKFGLALPVRNSARVTAEHARLAEEAGWDGVFLGDAVWTVDPMVALAAAAMTTRRIRLGTMLIPAPLRRPWKVASESVALDHLSEGRLILGLGAGAVWMGWDSFPDEVTDTRARAEMLDEFIDLLTLLHRSKPFDYNGQYYRVALTRMGEEHYPPPPVQQPRVPLWVPGLWPRKASMRRVVKCDGVFVETVDPEGRPVAPTPADVRKIAAYVAANRTLTTPFDIVVSGETGSMSAAECQETLSAWAEAGATWWVEALWNASAEEVGARIGQGTPRLSADPH